MGKIYLQNTINRFLVVAHQSLPRNKMMKTQKNRKKKKKKKKKITKKKRNRSTRAYGFRLSQKWVASSKRLHAADFFHHLGIRAVRYGVHGTTYWYRNVLSAGVGEKIWSTGIFTSYIHSYPAATETRHLRHKVNDGAPSALYRATITSGTPNQFSRDRSEHLDGQPDEQPDIASQRFTLRKNRHLQPPRK